MFLVSYVCYNSCINVGKGAKKTKMKEIGTLPAEKSTIFLTN
jgi:hypothetical protein